MDWDTVWPIDNPVFTNPRVVAALKPSDIWSPKVIARASWKPGVPVQNSG